MRPDQASAELARQTAELRQTRVDPHPLVEAARQVASTVRANASRNGHTVAVRVVAKGDGVRLTVVGPHAMRYRVMAEKQMDEMMPGVHAQIRAQITRRA